MYFLNVLKYFFLDVRMGILVGAIASSVLWLLATGSHPNKLRLEPTGRYQAFFTGDSFFITCVAGEKSGATRLTWQSPSGRDITVSSGRVHVEPAPHNPLGLELVFEDVKYEDKGRYNCSAIIDGQERKTYFILTVYLSISFWGTPEHQIGKEGDDFMVTCNVRADPNPIVSWYVNGSLVVDSYRHTLTEDGLYIRSLRPTDAGNYTCRAFVVTPHNSQMKDRNILVHVHYRPIWHVPHMEMTHGVLGSTTNLTCAAHSQPPPTFEWFRERALLGKSHVYTIINEKWKSTLQIKIKDTSVFGNYQCVVSNSMGEKQRTITIVEGVVPEAPRFELKSDEPGILIVKFAPTDSILPILSYRIQWRLVTDHTWRQARYHQARDGLEYVIHNLSFESTYSVRAAAYNAVGYSDFSEEITKRTKGLIAETVVDGSSMSSSLNSALPSSLLIHSFHRQVALLVLCVVVFTFR